MQIIFRCNNCEVINNISPDFLYRTCRNCGKFITYFPGEAIIDNEEEQITKQFLLMKTLDKSSAEEFFKRADIDEKRIEDLREKNSRIIKVSTIIDSPYTSPKDIVFFIINERDSITVDELIQKSQAFEISLDILEKLILKMKREGLIYQPNGWTLMLV
ncbi:MAG: hypothetical protein ACTSSG_05810 [Candidatus Heimdallarchaeaceae archaeon]